MTCRAALPTSSIGMRLLYTHTQTHTYAHTCTALSWGHAASRRSHGKWSQFLLTALLISRRGNKNFLQPRCVGVVVVRVGKGEV